MLFFSKWISLVLVLLIMAVSNVAGDTCDPNPDCSGAYPGDMVADPLNCRAFYLCLADGKPSDTSIPCEEDMYFDEWNGECVYGIECMPLCGGNCKMECNNTYDLVADYTNCNQYFVCLPSGPQAMSCPSDKPYFNGEDCTTERKLCCQPDCEAKCDWNSINLEIPDPYDCHSAYVCVNETYGYHFTCDNGCVFDHLQGHCDQMEPCRTVCTPLCTATTPVPQVAKPVTPAPTPVGGRAPHRKDTLEQIFRAMKARKHHG